MANISKMLSLHTSKMQTSASSGKAAEKTSSNFSLSSLVSSRISGGSLSLALASAARRDMRWRTASLVASDAALAASVEGWLWLLPGRGRFLPAAALDRPEAVLLLLLALLLGMVAVLTDCCCCCPGVAAAAAPARRRLPGRTGMVSALLLLLPLPLLLLPPPDLPLPDLPPPDLPLPDLLLAVVAGLDALGWTVAFLALPALPPFAFFFPIAVALLLRSTVSVSKAK